jgi:hypothetical protein
MSLIQKLAPDSYDKYAQRIGELRLAPVEKSVHNQVNTL